MRTFIALVSILEIYAIKKEEKSTDISKEDFSLELIGKSGKVIQDITSEGGKVIIGSEIWNAICEDKSKILSGTKVEVINRQGLTLFVKTKPDNIEA